MNANSREWVRDCREAFTEDELFRAHRQLLNSDEDARELAKSLTEEVKGSSIGVSWSQTTLILLSFLGDDVADRVSWVKKNCGYASSGLSWQRELAQLKQLRRDG